MDKEKFLVKVTKILPPLGFLNNVVFNFEKPIEFSSFGAFWDTKALPVGVSYNFNAYNPGVLKSIPIFGTVFNTSVDGGTIIQDVDFLKPPEIVE